MFAKRGLFSLKVGIDGMKMFFSKIYNFKSKYPVLFSHVHPDYQKLVDKECIDSGTIVKWVCNKGPDHVWESDLATRIRYFKRRGDFICLFCCGKKVSVTNSLATRFPEYAKEWLYEKNDGLKPSDVTCHSCKEVWWQCPNHSEHQYIMTPNDRTLYHQGCPFCSQVVDTEEKSLAHLFPEISSQWDYDKNGNLKPTDVLPSYPGKVWWVCPTDPSHHWKSSVIYRTRHGRTCPFCKKKELIADSLVSLNPELMKEWDFEKNQGIKPHELSSLSSKMIWWKCEHGVEWKESVIYRKQGIETGRHRCEKCLKNLQEKKMVGSDTKKAREMGVSSNELAGWSFCSRFLKTNGLRSCLGMIQEVVINDEDDNLYREPISACISERRDASEAMIATPVAQTKRSRIQNPSPTKVSEEFQLKYSGYQSLEGYLDYLKRTEQFSLVRPFMDKQVYINKGMRAILVDWMCELCNNYSLHRVTFHLAVQILDRYMMINHTIRRNEFQTIGAVCVVIATKLCEPVSVNMEMVIQATGRSCTREELVTVEHAIVNELDWHLLSGTLADWTLYFIWRLNDDGFLVPFDLYYRCMDLCDRLILDADYCRYRLPEVSLAVVSAFSCEDLEFQSALATLIDEFSLNSDCVKWVLSIGMAAPSHPLLVLLDGKDGEKTRKLIQTKQEMFMEFNYAQPYNQFSLTHYSSTASK